MNSTVQLSGRDLGRRVVANICNYVSRSLSGVTKRLDEMQQVLTDTPSLAMVREEVKAAVHDEVNARLLDDPTISASFAKAVMQNLESSVALQMRVWQMEFEKQAADTLAKAISEIPKPRDGNSIEDFNLEFHDGSVVVSMLINGDVVTRELELPIPRYLGIYQAGVYKPGSMVTFSGSIFCALVETDKKPGESPDWQLAVKRGRDGKQGAS